MRSLFIRSTLAFTLLLPCVVLAQDATVEAETPAATETTEVTADAVIATDVPTEAQAEVQADVTAEVETEQSEVIAATEGTASTDASTNERVGAPPAGKGQIVFFREKKFAGSAVRYKVREGETELGKLASGIYFVQAVEPGTHDYTVHSEAKDVLTLEVDAGETYYVQGTITMGFLAGRPNLSPSDEATFVGMSKKLKLAQ